jgi:hypothetical protein
MLPDLSYSENEKKTHFLEQAMTIFIITQMNEQ